MVYTWQVAKWDWGAKFKILFNFILNLNNHMWLVATVLESTALELISFLF